MLQEIAKLTLLKKAARFGLRHPFLGVAVLAFLAWRNRDALKRAISGRSTSASMSA